MSGSSEVAAFLVKGDDPALVAEALRKVLDDLTGDGTGLAVEEFAGEEMSIDAVADACQTPPFLEDKRIVVLRDVGRFKTEEVQPLIDYLADPLPTTKLVLVAGGGQTPVKLLNAVKKAGRVVDASTPTGKGRTTWLVDRVRNGPVDLDNEATRLIGDHLGDDIGRLGPLLDGLATVFGEGTRVSADDVLPFLGEAGGVAPWDLTDAIDVGDTETALTHLRRMTVGGGRHPLETMATLHRHYAAMLRLDGAGVSTEAQAADILGMKPYPAKKVLAQGRRLGSKGVQDAIELLAAADLDLRGKRAWPPDLVMEVLVARLSRLAKTAARR